MVNIRVLFFLFCVSLLNTTTVVAKEVWLTVKDFDLRVQKGSALDFEPLFKNQQSNFGDKWDNRYLCAPLVFTKPQGFVPRKQELEQIVLELKSRGYNLVRLHFLDSALMKDAKGDFDFNGEQADRIYYLLHLLNQHNIQYIIDAATSWNGAYYIKGNRSAKKYDLRLDVHFSPSAQDHWKKMVDLMLASKNPYTGRPTLMESNLIAITTVNEMGLGFNTRRNKTYPLKVQYKFQDWLKSKGYKKVASLKRSEVSEASSLMNEFLVETEKKTFAWMEQYLRELGYKGKITAYNNGKSVQAMGARQDLELISVHAYHDHPSKFVRRGSQISNNSSVALAFPYIQYMSLVRELGKPFIVDEYNQPFWNEWRREAGIAMPAYAAFQGWQAICRYANPIVLKYRQQAPKRQRAIYPFSVGMDPVARAGEALSALLFRRGDVAQGERVLGVLFKDSDFTSSDALNKKVSPAFTKLSLLTSIGVVYNQVDRFSPETIIPFVQEGWKNPRGKQWSGNLREIRKSNIVYASNSNEIISSTKELFLNTKEKKFKVVTPQTEAIVYDRLASVEPLKQMSVLEASGKAALSISSLDTNDLSTSSRMLIIFATDARNSRSQLNSDGTRLLKLGRLPVQIKSQSVSFSLETKNSSDMKLYALNLRGERVQRLQVQEKGGALLININLLTLKNGPTTFFELATK